MRLAPPAVIASCTAVACLVIGAACRSGTPAVDPAAADVAAATKETEDWRAQHEKSYRTNWATIAGLHFLEPGSHTAGTATTNDIVLPASADAERIGRFVLVGDVVQFEPSPGSRVVIYRKPVTKAIRLADDAATEPDTLE